VAGTGGTSVFEAVFGIRSGHVLRLAGARQRVAGRVRQEWWEHEEFDAEGRLIAVYESWAVSDAMTGRRADGGFVEYSATGEFVRRRSGLEAA
jgi:hypothetical protein